MDLPVAVVEQDHKLERATARSSELLAGLRWHWTLDETNPDRVGASDYARAVGRAQPTIWSYARGYAGWVADNRGTPIIEAINRERMSADREAATEAVAEARGLAFETTRKTRPSEVKRVLEVARERVEKQGGTIEEQTAKAADWVVRSEKAAKDVTTARKARFGMRFIGLEDRLQRVRRELIEAVNEAAAVGWGDEERDLLAATLAQVKALLELLDMAVVGAADVDWDAELAGLEG